MIQNNTIYPFSIQKKAGFWTFFVLILFVFTARAQTTPTVIASETFSAAGKVDGIPTINFNIPAGKNRVMVINVLFERYHNPYNSNWHVGADGATSPGSLGVQVGGIAATSLISNNAKYNESSGNDNTVRLSTHYSTRYLSDSQGLPTGNVNINFTNVNLPESVADEIAVAVTVFENANQTPLFVDYTSSDGFITAANYVTVTGVAPSIPVGNTTSNILYYGAGMLSQQKAISVSTGWAVDNSVVVTNNNGVAVSPTSAATEPDGISLNTFYRTIASGSPSFSLSRATPNPVTMRGAGYLYAILPLARPSVTGNVYLDTDGSTNINGTATNAAGTYINVVNSAGNLVFSAAVNASGSFTIPAGYVEEGSTYRLELSKNTGTVGTAAPLKELPSGWGIVGESTTASPYPNDGTNDGIINLTVGNVNITGLRYGITNVCAAGATAPALTSNTKSNSCPSPTVDLTTTTATNQNAGLTLTWHTGSVANNANKVANPAAINQGGTYYAAFYDAAVGCYSTGTTPVTVTISKCTTVTNTCPATTVNLTTLVAASSDPNIEITWHTGTLATDANKVANPAAVGAGTYYASFHDIAGGCYSPTTGAVTVAITDCVTPFPCDNSAYLSKGLNANVQLFKHNLLTGITDTTPLVSFNTLANGLAYNPVNNTLWILVTPAPTNTSKAKLTRIDAAGVVTTFDVPNLSAALGINPTSATITTAGYYVAKVSASPLTGPGGGANANDGDNYVVIDVNPSRATYLQIVDPANGFAIATAPYYKETIGNVLINAADFAYNPADGLLYGMDTTGKLVSLNIVTGAFTQVNTVVLPDGTSANSSAYVASFIDATGSLYSINVNTGVTYRVNVPSGKAILLPSAAPVNNMDGANCPTAVFTFAVQGNVFEDTNGTTDNIVNGTPTNLTNSLNAILYNNSTGAVAAITPVAANGAYAFATIPGSSYTVYITTSTATVGQAAVPVVALPSGWINTGENNCGNNAGCTGSDGTPNGILSLGVVSADISQANFGVNKLSVCYKPGATGGTVLDSQHGITALRRAGSDNGNWPMARKGAWTVLESKTKGFVINRLTDIQVSLIPTDQLVEGMMLYNVTQDCLQINTDGTAAGWKCFKTQTCPD